MLLLMVVYMCCRMFVYKMYKIKVKLEYNKDNDLYWNLMEILGKISISDLIINLYYILSNCINLLKISK